MNAYRFWHFALLYPNWSYVPQVYFAYGFFLIDDLYHFVSEHPLCRDTNRFSIYSGSFFLLVSLQFCIDPVCIIIISLCRLINYLSHSIISLWLLCSTANWAACHVSPYTSPYLTFFFATQCKTIVTIIRIVEGFEISIIPEKFCIASWFAK